MTRETPWQGDSHSGGKGARAVFLRNRAEVSTVVQSLLGATSIPKEHSENDSEVLGDVGQWDADLLDTIGGELMLAAGKGLVREGRYLVCEVLPSEWEALLEHFGLSNITIDESDQGTDVIDPDVLGFVKSPSDKSEEQGKDQGRGGYGGR